MSGPLFNPIPLLVRRLARRLSVDGALTFDVFDPTGATRPEQKTALELEPKWLRLSKAVRLFRFTCSAKSLVATLRRQAIALSQKQPRKTEMIVKHVATRL